MNGFIDEVISQGELIQSVSSFYLAEGKDNIKNICNIFRNKEINRVILAGMGSSLYAIDSVKSYLTERNICALSYSAHELSHYQFNQIDKKTLLIAISQSGKSSEVLELVEKASGKTEIVGISNEKDSPLNQMVSLSLPLLAGKEISITSKTYESTILVLNILARALTGTSNEKFWDQIQRLGTWLKMWMNEWHKNVTPLFEFAKNGLLYDLLANNASLATAKQLSLAYREGLHNCTAVWECADYAHGQYHSSKLGKNYIAQMFFPKMKPETKEYKMMNYILAHGGRVLLYTSSPIESKEGLMVYHLPEYEESLMPLIESPVAETLLGMLFGSNWVKDH